MFSRTIIAIIGGLLLFTSCDVTDDSKTDLNDSIGTLRVYLTDSPANYEAVWIDISEVRIHLNEEAEEDEDGWITVNQDPIKINLLDLTNGELKVLGETELEAGRYSQVRLILGDENEIVEKGGVSHALMTPSAQESGLKLNINVEIEGGEIYTLLLDFDASKSIVEAGKSGKFILKPVLRVVQLEHTGAIDGSIEPAEALPWVYAIANEDTVAGTKADNEGDFRIIGLLTGIYQLSIEPTEGDYSDKEVSDVEVTAPDTTQIGVITLEEE